MRTLITASEGHWLTQSEQNPIREVQIFVKSLPVNTPANWTEWTDAQKTEYEQSHPKGKAAMRIFLSHCNLNKLQQEFMK